MEQQDYRTELFRLASPLFLFLVSFRRKVRKGYQVDETEVRQELDKIITAMDLRSRRDPRLDVLYQKAKYPLVILADEVLLASDWSQAREWEQNPLEMQHCNTNIGGDKVFQIAEELMYDEVEMAVILYTAICLGVKGRYHRQPEKLQEVKSKLFRQLGEYLGDVQNIITPDAYRVTEKAAQRLPVGIALINVAIACGVLFVSYILANIVIWRLVVNELRDMTADLL